MIIAHHDAPLPGRSAKGHATEHDAEHSEGHEAGAGQGRS